MNTYFICEEFWSVKIFVILYFICECVCDYVGQFQNKFQLIDKNE